MRSIPTAQLLAASSRNLSPPPPPPRAVARSSSHASLKVRATLVDVDGHQPRRRFGATMHWEGIVRAR